MTKSVDNILDSFPSQRRLSMASSVAAGRRLSMTSVVSALDCSESQSVLAIDIADNHSKKCMTIQGRESHTADLDEFDRYMELLKQYQCSFDYYNNNNNNNNNASKETTNTTSNNYDNNNDNNNNNKTTDETQSYKSNTSFKTNDSDNSISIGLLSYTNADDDNSSSDKVWSYVRSVLEEARPVGYSEIEDSSGVVAKGPDDVGDFFKKVIGISSINPIHPNVIAEQCGLPVELVLEELFHATKVGLLQMLWTPECVRCGSAACTADSLTSIPQEVDCDSCSLHNEIETLDHIKVVFTLVSSVLYIPADNFACTPSALSMSRNAIFTPVPATDSGSGFRYSTGCGGPKQLRESLPKGKYRMHCPVAMTDSYLVVENDATEQDRPVKLNLPVSELVCHGACTPRKTITVPHGRVHFDVHADTGSFFILWVQHDQDDEDALMYLPAEERASFTTAGEVIHHPTFHTLFPKQVVPGSEVWSLSISKVILVFTDIVGSTAMYANLGDGKALELVRRHFKVLFRAFRRGRVVKTIGDAVMAAFPSARAAMEAVAEALQNIPKYCKKPDQSPLEIRVGIHAGSACVVPLNGISDYFGQTVNVAARVEAAAKASEALVTESVFHNDPDAQKAYNDILQGKNNQNCCYNNNNKHYSYSPQFIPMPLVQLNLKGVEGSVLARGFRVIEMAKRSESVKFTPTQLKFLQRVTSSDTTNNNSLTFDSNEQPILASKHGRRVSRSQNHNRIDIDDDDDDDNNDDSFRSLSMNDLLHIILDEQDKKKKKEMKDIILSNQKYKLQRRRHSLFQTVSFATNNNNNNNNTELRRNSALQTTSISNDNNDNNNSKKHNETWDLPNT